MSQEKGDVTGSRLGNFVPLGKIGEGSFSSVHKVRRVDDGKIYALKRVKLNNLKAKEKQCALNEIMILSTFKSPNIISYREAFIEKRTEELCIVLEWANEGDLIADINNHKKEKLPIPESEIWRAAIDILQGLHILHINSILHRDIKSANIFKSEGVYKLGDLNISKICGGLAYTQTGTPYYASPEVWKQLPYNNKSDIWSFGCVIYEMCQLEPPFRGRDMKHLYNSVTNGKYPALSPIYSIQMKRLIQTCLQVDPRERPSCEELLKLDWIKNKAKQYRINIPIPAKRLKNSSIVERSFTEPRQALSLINSNLPEPNYEKEIKEGKKKRVLLLPSNRPQTGTKRIRPHSSHRINRISKINEEKNKSIGQKPQKRRPISAVHLPLSNQPSTVSNYQDSPQLVQKPLKYYYPKQKIAPLFNRKVASNDLSQHYSGRKRIFESPSRLLNRSQESVEEIRKGRGKIQPVPSIPFVIGSMKEMPRMRDFLIRMKIPKYRI